MTLGMGRLQSVKVLLYSLSRYRKKSFSGFAGENG